MFLCSFARFFEILLGNNFFEFNTFFASLKYCTECLTFISDFDYFLDERHALGFLMLILFFFIMKFLLYNMFLSIIYHGYQKAKEEKSKDTNIGFYEFFGIIPKLLNCGKKKKNYKKCNDIYTQIINKSDSEKVKNNNK